MTHSESESETPPTRRHSLGRSFQCAWRGIRIVAGSERNFQIQAVISVLAISLSIFLGISTTEWLAVIFAIGFVLVAETINTAIEITLDRVSLEKHELTRNAKDIAAGATLLAAITATTVGIVIFLPKLWAMVGKMN